jgi:hypothetical protein
MRFSYSYSSQSLFPSLLSDLSIPLEQKIPRQYDTSELHSTAFTHTLVVFKTDDRSTRRENWIRKTPLRSQPPIRQILFLPPLNHLLYLSRSWRISSVSSKTTSMSLPIVCEYHPPSTRSLPRSYTELWLLKLGNLLHNLAWVFQTALSVASSHR